MASFTININHQGGGAGGGGGGSGGGGRGGGQLRPLVPTENRPFWDPIQGRYVSKGGLSSELDPAEHYEGKEGGKQDPSNPKGGGGLGSIKGMLGMAMAGTGLGGTFQDVSGVMGAGQMGMAAGGPAGAAIGVAIGVFKLATDKFSESVEKMRQYSGDVAGAASVADVRSILMDIKEAQELGPQMAEFVDNWSQLQNEMRDAFIPLKKIGLDLVNAILPMAETGADVAKGVAVIIEMLKGMAKSAGKMAQFDMQGAHDELIMTYVRMQDIAQRQYDKQFGNPNELLERFYTAGTGETIVGRAGAVGIDGGGGNAPAGNARMGQQTPQANTGLNRAGRFLEELAGAVNPLAMFGFGRNRNPVP